MPDIIMKSIYSSRGNILDGIVRKIEELIGEEKVLEVYLLSINDILT